LNSAKILVVDDEPQLRRAMRVALTELGYTIMEAKTGEEALENLHDFDPDLILLDINMPGMGGMEACRALRRVSNVPIVILSVRNSEQDKVAALDAGADDYVTKPFGIQELLARIRAALRRSASQEQEPQVIKTEDFEIDLRLRIATVRGQQVRLTPKEFEVLKFLAQNANEPITHRRLLQAVWGPDYGDEVEYLRVLMNSLRKKIEPSPSSPKYLITVPWIGYRLAVSAEAVAK
jgi:two-component system, OmpR family, KDP operon response regulator KdpE